MPKERTGSMSCDRKAIPAQSFIIQAKISLLEVLHKYALPRWIRNLACHINYIKIGPRITPDRGTVKTTVTVDSNGKSYI